jgi:hemolysin activation/secretion protein
VRRGARLALLLSGLATSAFAQQIVRPDIDPGLVQRRIPAPSAPERAAPALSLPAPREAAPGLERRFVLAGVVIEGATVFAAQELAPFYENDLAREIGEPDVERILADITAAYRRKGYFLSRAIALPQPVEAGVLRVTVIEGYVRRVVLEGARPGEEEGVLRYFAEVVGDRPLRLDRLERVLLLVGALPGLEAHASLAPAEDERSGAFDLVLRLDHRSLAGTASLDNRGTESLGPWELTASGAASGLVGDFDRLALGVFTTPNRLRELLSTELLYNRPLDSTGTELALTLVRTQLKPGGSLSGEAIDGLATRYAASFAHPLLLSRAQSLWLSGTLDVPNSSEREQGAPLFDDRLRVLRIATQYRSGDGEGSASDASLELSQGVDALGASHPGAADLSRANGRSDFTKALAALTREQALGRDWALALALAGQKSAQPLLLSEQFALGGARFGRAYDPAEVTGDDALAGSLELRYGRAPLSPLLRSYQFYGFYDLGAAWNMGVSNATRRQSLASLGGGVRLSLPRNLAASLEIARPMTHTLAAGGHKPVRAFVVLSAGF